MRDQYTRTASWWLTKCDEFIVRFHILHASLDSMTEQVRSELLKPPRSSTSLMSLQVSLKPLSLGHGITPTSMW